MAEPTLIPWDQVADGPVWFRFSGDAEWLYGVKLKRLGILLGPGHVPYYATDIPHLQFTPAEQQPSEWAAKVTAAETRANAAVTALRMAERTQQHNTEQAIKAALMREAARLESEQAMNAALTLQLDSAESSLTRLRDGLAALEQEMREHCASGQPAFDSQIREWVDDLAALREGQ